MVSVPDIARLSRTTLLVCMVGACVCLWMGFSLTERAADFNQFYSAGKLVGGGELYQWERMRALERLHATNQIPFGRIPFYAVLFKPLAALPYGWARAGWLALNALAMLMFAVLWPVEDRARLAIGLCWCFPAALLLATGQDSGMFLLFVAVGVRLLESDHDIAAGLVFSLCAAKIHLALGIPVFLLARRRWAALLAGAAAGVAQAAVSFAAEGWDWPAKLLRLASIPEFSPAVAKMPNLHGLTYQLRHGGAAEVVLALLALAAVWRIARRSTLVTGAACAAAAGLLVSHHAYVYDAILLLPALALTRREGTPATLRYWALLLGTPIPYLLLMDDRLAAIGQAGISLFCLALLAVLAAGDLSPRAVPLVAAMRRSG